ncbi:TPA: fimbria/pilus periplasmic chaperone [Enterobacter asburiae]|uniref:fimbria/pilus periplasmic chaperone n=1 Tax=Enterobacter TaxID=547 RepID=UPI002A82D9AC|nr:MULTISPECIES: fimbria/pilus periplasmic chaperone [unclassified Enterobacter]
MNLNNIAKFIFIFALLSFTKVGVCGGIALGSTRIIYNADKKSTVLNITNSDEKKRFLIQSWIETEDGEKSDNFILTPPLFVSKPSSENTIRISYIGDGEAAGKETIFYLNSKAIPSLEKKDMDGKNVLQIAVLSRIKLIYRPNGIYGSSLDAYKKLQFLPVLGGMQVKNPTPYFITLINFKINNEKVSTHMFSPYSTTLVPFVKHDKIINLSFQSVNDFGGNSPVTSVKL